MDWRELGVQGSKKKEPSIKSTKKALEKLGRPDRDYKIILVGGTNGKGSTVEMISELLQSSGNDVGVNKSPHLKQPHERIQYNSQNIQDSEFNELVREVKKLDIEFSFFELMTVMALRYFSKREVDYAVLEVGMGGRLDATNAAEHSLSVITNIGFDHKKYLGESRDKIAREIGGIVPEDGKVITDTDLPALNKIIESRNTKIEKPSNPSRLDGEIFYKGETFEIPVKGSYQIENLSNAIKTVEVLNEMPEDTEEALEELNCRGRMEKVSENPVTILDGAHNPGAIEKVTKEFPEDFVCVFNCTESKEAEKMIQIIENRCESFIFTSSNIDWSENPENLVEKTEIDSEVVKNPEKALEKAREKAGSEGCVLVTGSLYLVGNLIEL